MKKYQTENRAKFVGALFCVLTSTLMAVALQFFKGNVLDSAVAGRTNAAVQSAGLLAIFILGETLWYYAYKRLAARYVVDCTRALKRDLFARIIRMDYVAFKAEPQGAYIAKCVQQADTLKARLFAMQPLLWELVFKIVLVSIALLWLDVRIALVTLTLLTTPLYVPKLIEKKLQQTQSRQVEAVAQHMARLTDWFAGFEIIKNFSVENQIQKRFDASNDEAMSALLCDMQLGAASQLLTTLMSYLSYFAVMVCAAWLVLEGSFTAGDFFVAIGMIDQLSYPLIALAEIIRQLVASQPLANELAQFVASPAPDMPIKHPLSFEEAICFRNVCFAYEGKPPVLDAFSLTLRKNGRYLVTGPSGCGKTTLINLLLQYYTPCAGRITIDAAPLEQLAVPYALMTVVRQEAVLFQDTLRNNLTLYTDHSDAELIAMLRHLGLTKFASIDALNSMVAENGANFSGGEKKRICLGRAFLRNTEVLILDEPLANLDRQTARAIEDLLLSLQQKTLIVVSHQFSEEKLSMFDQVVELGA